MTPQEIVELVRGIYAQPQFAHYTLKPDTLAAYRAELDDLPLPLRVAQAAVRSLLLEDDGRLPTPQGIRKRVLREAGLLAPSWPEAKTMIDGYIEAYAADRELPDLPGPVQDALDARGGAYAARDADNQAAWFAQLRDTYRECAARHDLFMAEPGGIDRFREVCEWVAAAKARRELLARARNAAALLTDPLSPLLLPSGGETDAELQALVSEAERRFPAVDPDELPDRRADLDRLLDVLFNRKGIDRG